MDLGRYSVAKHRSELIYVRDMVSPALQFIRIVLHAVSGYDTRPHADCREFYIYIKAKPGVSRINLNPPRPSCLPVTIPIRSPRNSPLLSVTMHFVSSNVISATLRCYQTSEMTSARYPSDLTGNGRLSLEIRFTISERFNIRS